jgi:hypothetical protein
MYVSTTTYRTTVIFRRYESRKTWDDGDCGWGPMWLAVCLVLVTMLTMPVDARRCTSRSHAANASANANAPQTEQRGPEGE